MTGGYGYRLIEKIWSEVERRTDFELHHVPDPSLFRSNEPARPRFNSSRLLYVFDTPQKNLPKADIDFLTELEGSTGPTIGGCGARGMTSPRGRGVETGASGGSRRRA